MPLQVEDVNSILKPEIEETLLHAAASLGSILCAKLLLEVKFFAVGKATQIVVPPNVVLRWVNFAGGSPDGCVGPGWT